MDKKDNSQNQGFWSKSPHVWSKGYPKYPKKIIELLKKKMFEK